MSIFFLLLVMLKSLVDISLSSSLSCEADSTRNVSFSTNGDALKKRIVKGYFRRMNQKYRTKEPTVLWEIIMK